MSVPLSVVIPVRDEARGLPGVLKRCRKAGLPEGFEVIVVDDGSSDGSGEIAREEGAGVIRLEGKGYGGALKAGFARANGEWLAFLDGDDTYPPEWIPGAWEKAKEGEAMLVMNRFGPRSRMPLVRWLGNRVLTGLARARVDGGIKDLCSGLRLFPASWKGDFEDLPDGLDFSPAMTLRVSRRRRLVYLDGDYDDRQGQSKLSLLGDGWRFMRETIRG